MVFLDTNILVYSRDEASPYFSSVCEALNGLTRNGVELCVNKQILREYACVATRPAPRGFSASIEQALSDIAEFETAYLLIPEPEDIWKRWKLLVKSSRTVGLCLHDAYIAAAMIEHGIVHILTLNTGDFKRFHGVIPIKPESWQEIAEYE